MNNEQQPIEKIDELFLSRIILNESQGLLADLSLQPTLMVSFMSISEQEYDQCLYYVSKILISCFQNGEIKVIMNSDGENLIGYALFFEHPDSSFARYCHKIYVYEEFRKKGIGTQLLTDLLDDSENITLLCSPELIPFYEKSGMKFGGYYEIPDESDEFKHTRNMYHGLAVMNGKAVSGPAPIFMLNNNDVKNLLSLIN